MVNRMDDGGLTDGYLTQPSGGDEAEATVGEETLPGRTKNPSRLACQRTGMARSSWRLRDGVVWKKVVIGGGLLVILPLEGGDQFLFLKASFQRSALLQRLSPATAPHRLVPQGAMIRLSCSTERSHINGKKNSELDKVCRV